MVLLMVITVGYVPIVLPLLLPGVSVNPAQIARSLVLLMLLPLGGALAVKANRPDIAAKIKPIFDKTSNLSLIALMALQTLLNVRSVMAVFGTGGILAGVVFLGVGFAVWLGPWRLNEGDAIRPGARNGAAEYRRRTRRGQPELRRPERRGDGRRHCDRRAVDPHAAVARAWAGPAAGVPDRNRLTRRRFHFTRSVLLRLRQRSRRPLYNGRILPATQRRQSGSIYGVGGRFQSFENQRLRDGGPDFPQMEPTDQLDAPNRRLPESRIKRFANVDHPLGHGRCSSQILHPSRHR